MDWPACIVDRPHIVADPCKPRWVVKCTHGFWFWHATRPWVDKRNEFDAYVALWGLYEKLLMHDERITLART